MTLNRLSSLAFAVVVLSLAAVAQDSLVEHLSGNVPVQLRHVALTAERPVVPPVKAAQPLAVPAAHNWQLLATLPGAVIHDISFASPLVGYAAAELGQVWKTTNGGQTWTEVLNLGAPYYFYGVQALLDGSVVISGFYDSSTNFEGLIRWSKDGGQTWTGDQVVTTTGSVQRVRFTYRNNGLIMDLVGGSSGNTDQVTSDGGFKGSYWTTFVDNPSGGWFGLQYSYLNNFVARASGINFCTSDNGGGEWTCGPSVDSVFDGRCFFSITATTVGWAAGKSAPTSKAGST